MEPVRSDIGLFLKPWVSVRRWVRHAAPVRLLVAGYASYVAIGWLLLCMPFSLAPGAHATILDHLFTSASAVSTTGLATVSPADTYNWFGEFVILALIQVGGIGYMTVGSFVVLSATGDLPAWRRRVSSAAISLPEDFDIASFVKAVIWFTLIVEALGAAALYFFVFAGTGVETPLWSAIFHSISSFCTAGFALYNDSFEGYRDHIPLNMIVIVLSYLGAMGYIVLLDLWLAARKRRRPTFTTKVIVVGTLLVSVVGTLFFALDEPAVQVLPWGERLLASWFQVMSASTTVGFDTVSIGTLSASSVVLLTIAMVVGASPAGTGGGLKTTTLTANWAVAHSTARGQSVVTFLGRPIPESRIAMAVANLYFYVLTLSIGCYLLALVEDAPLPDVVFECASGLGTVGLSRGITGALTDWGKIIVVALMFVGRVGPTMLVMACFAREASAAQDAAELREPSDVAI